MIAYVGRLTDLKQPMVFAETMRLLADGVDKFVAVVVGDGKDRPRLAAFIAEHRLEEKIRLVGAVRSQRMLEILQGADVFFLPSQWEGVALTIYEAMACALPVVGADVGGQAELVTPETGILLDRAGPREEAVAYAGALRSLLSEPELGRQMGVAGRERVASLFSLETMGDRLVGLIERAIELHDTEPRPAVPVESARASATLAVDYHRTTAALEELTREPAPKQPAVLVGVEHDPTVAGGWRWWTYRALTVPLGPTYRRVRNASWMVKARDRARMTLGVDADRIPWSDEAETQEDQG